MRGFTMFPLVLALVLTGTALPALAETTGEPVSLVVGLRPGADTAAPVDRLEDRTSVDVVDTEPVTGDRALTVDVASDDVTAAAAALRSDPNVAYVEVDHIATTAAVTANDPYRAKQWGLDRARVASAWNSTTGSATTVVAVVDTGVRTVSDLAGRMAQGWDFVNDDSNATDDEGHGTEVATTLAGAGNNRAGVAGVCWACRIMPVKALDRDGSGSYSDIASDINWAADHGADIINLSLGGSSDSQVLRNAVAHATSKGVLVIAAAGNDGTTAKHYPAAIPAVLSVGASTSLDQRYSWSNFGNSWVDIAGPGCGPAQTMAGTVETFCGTSAATPFVAGVAGLLKSLTPTPTGEQVKSYLTGSAAHLSGAWVASGRVDAVAAIARVPLWTADVASGSYVRGDTPLNVHVGTTVGIVDTVRITADGDQVALDTAAPYATTAHFGPHAGAVTLTVVASRSGATVASFSLPVTVDNTAPDLTFRTPTSASEVRGTVTASATVVDPLGVDKVQLLVDGTVVGTDYAAPYAVSWQSGTANRTAKLSLRAYDKAGNVTTASRWVVADNTAPLVRITTGPANAKTVKGTVNVGVSASDARGVAKVEVLLNGVVVGSYAGAARTFAVNTDPYGRTVRMQVRAYDRAGNVRYAASRTWRS